MDAEKRHTVRTIKAWCQGWLQRGAERAWSIGDHRANRQWWRRHEDRVYQLIPGILPLQTAFPILNEDVITQAISLVLDIERRKADGRLFREPLPPSGDAPHV